MPLIQSKSKKAFSKNVEKEMEAGKPQKQALGIAYSIKRKNKRKMAEGGVVSASNEKRPMPDQSSNDQKQVSQNSSKKALVQSNWTDQPTVAQAQRPSLQKLKHPKMVPQNSYSVRMRDQEDDIESSMKPDGYGKQPSKAYDEASQRQTSSDPDESKPHSTRKAYAQGGEVLNETSVRPDKGFGKIIIINKDDQEHRLAEGGMINNAVRMHEAEEDQVQHPEGLESDDDQMRPAQDEYMADKAQQLAEGGLIHEFDEQPDQENEIEQHASVASAIMAKRKQASESAESESDIDRQMFLAEGGMVDLDENAMEQPNSYYHQNEVAALKENYDEDMHGVDQPMDSNLHGDSEEMSEENEHDEDMVSAIRRKMKAKSPISR